jgi:hypothetical protein
MYFGQLEIRKKPGEIHFEGSEMNFERPGMHFGWREMHLEAFCGRRTEQGRALCGAGSFPIM